jgi:hypothetical protein
MVPSTRTTRGLARRLEDWLSAEWESADQPTFFGPVGKSPFGAGGENAVPRTLPGKFIQLEPRLDPFRWALPSQFQRFVRALVKGRLAYADCLAAFLTAFSLS